MNGTATTNLYHSWKCKAGVPRELPYYHVCRQLGCPGHPLVFMPRLPLHPKYGSRKFVYLPDAIRNWPILLQIRNNASSLPSFSTTKNLTILPAKTTLKSFGPKLKQMSQQKCLPHGIKWRNTFLHLS